MTIPRTPGSAMSRRVFWGGVVPILYLLALVAAVMLATATRHHARTGWTPAAAKLTQRTHAPARRERRVVHHRVSHRAPAAHRASVPAHLESASNVEPAVSRSSDRLVPSPAPHPALVIRIAAVATPSTMQSAINACDGPVEIAWSSDPFQWGALPNEIAEHDYCGGAVFDSLAAGQRVEVVGGDLGGLYVVNGNRRFATAGASADVLSGVGDVVLQTCVPNGVVLVGLDRVD